MIINCSSHHIPIVDRSVHCVVTSPPYWGLRSYQGAQSVNWPEVVYSPMPGLQEITIDAMIAPLGLEKSVDAFIGHLILIFREVWRTLRDDGVIWANMGDCYAYDSKWGGASGGKNYTSAGGGISRQRKNSGIRDKSLVGQPWRLAFALEADGWILRRDVIWHKRNPTPESCDDRPTNAHEYVFLLAKDPDYFYDKVAIMEPSLTNDPRHPYLSRGAKDFDGRPEEQWHGGKVREDGDFSMRNRRDVWSISTEGYRGAHYATFPRELVSPCVLAGTSARGVCPICGAPWTRVTKKNFSIQDDVSADRAHHGADGQKALDETSNWEGFPRGVTNVATLGWRPTCDHGADPVPAVVMDPFCGSGTVGMVCRETGRKFVGLDISFPYLRDQARARAENKAAPVDETLPLFAAVE